MKYTIYFTLWVVFFGFMIKAYLEMKSEKTGTITSKELRATKIPSFTVCPWPITARFLQHGGFPYDEVIQFMNIENVSQIHMKLGMSYNGSS